jgi:hypothetical protein
VKRAATLLAFLTFAVSAPSASGAEFGIVPGSLAIRMLDAEGQPAYRAGSHPDRLQIDFALNVEGTGTSLRDFALELPPGFSGNADAVPECPRELFEKAEEECPVESRVGVVSLALSGGGELTLPVFRLEPRPGELLAFGSIPGLDIPLTMELRPTDYGITFSASDLPEASVSEAHMELWGVPADHQPGTSAPRRPFLTVPTGCGPLAVTLRARSWQEGAPWVTAGAETPPLSGCQDLAFEPQLGLQLGNPVADSPTGARIQLSMSEGEDPDGLANAQIKNATVELPQGLTVSPGGAAGITACSDAEFGLGETTEARCPPSSRVGTTEFESSELPEPLTGDVYVGEEHPGERFRLLIAAPGPGVTVKFVSSLRADLVTGRLSTVLKNLPQVPLTRLTLSIEGGPRALLASPLACGSFATVGHFESYSGGPATDSNDLVAIAPSGGSSQCQSPPAFSPKLVVTRSTEAAGRPTLLSTTVERQSGEDLIKRFALSLPGSLSAGLGGIESCPEPGAAAGVCPAGSAIGSAVAEVGSGPSLVAIHGDVYVAGPYHRAPFSLVITFGSAVGPFDLSAMAIRSALQIQPGTGRVTVVSDPLPELVEGVPIRFRTFGMALDRPGAVHNPTACAAAAASATFESSHGASASATSALAVKGCRRLGFKPHFSLHLADRSQLHRHGRPRLLISGSFRRGDTHLRAMRMSFPSALKFELSGLGEICPARDAIDSLCSPRARVGTAYARTSLFSQPLKGSIYIVQPAGDGLPDLWLDLTAMGVHLSVRGRTSVHDGQPVTNLVGLPDVPISALGMRLRGGRHGVLSLAVEPCVQDRARRLVSRISAAGQNGAHRRLQPRVKAPCGKTAGS